MSEKSITIEGKEYISSERAAKLVGYTKDYVGQLARAGKIKSKRIGRSWYIEEESINKHKLSVHYILTKPKKSPSKSNEYTEKANKYIDISSNTESGEESSDNYLINKRIDKNSINDFKSEDTEYDLLPRLKEKKHDALLHADIRYENVKVPQAQYSNQTSTAKAFEVNNSHIKEISIRKSLPTRRNSRVSFNTGTQPRIDGIVMSTNKREYSNVSNRSRNSIESNQRKQQKIVYTENTNNDTYQKEETSKIIPVVGGIVLFTIFVVAYLLFTV